MLKHILTGQPSSVTGFKYQPQHPQHNDYQTTGAIPSPNDSQKQQQYHHQLHTQQALSSSLQLENHPHHHHGTTSRMIGPVVRAASSDVYDSVLHPSMQRSIVRHTVATPSSVHRHSLNHSQSSVNNLSQRLNGSSHHTHALNFSTLSASKHSVNSASPVANGASLAAAKQQFSHQKVIHLCQENRPKANGGLDISRLDMSRLSRIRNQMTPSPAQTVHMTLPISQTPTISASKQMNHFAGHQQQLPSTAPFNSSWSTSSLSKYKQHSGQKTNHELGLQQTGVKEMLTSLGLLCLVSLLLALLSLVFLLKISPLTVTPSSLISPEEYAIVYEVTLALCALALSLNLCCLLVCAIQFLFTVKLVKNSYQGYRTNKYLQKSSISRVCAVGGFFISIPVFLTGMILYTFIQFHSTPAIVTSILIGLGIVFCGCAMVHNVFVWQREKTNAIKALAREQCETMQRQQISQQQQQIQQHRTMGPALQQNIYTNKEDHGMSLRGTMACGQQPSLSVYGSRQQRRHMVSPAAPLLLATTMHSHQHHHHHHPSVNTSPRGVTSAITANHMTNATGATTTTITTTMSPSTTPGDHSPPSPMTNHHHRPHLIARENTDSVSPGLPAATLDLSSAAATNSPHELSTLV